ncbi:MAG: PQQ-dependent sugar dehydrogenase, partial [Anaerolineales bacterium]|nr:PQQ-dependent sugar dehydrogenase [Anaerolineales bacterium]
RAGLIYEITGEGTVLPDPVLVITDQIGSLYYQQGLLSFVFDPDFQSNHYLYTHYTDLDGDIVISRFTVSGTISATVPLQPIDPATELILLEVEHPNTSDENSGGELSFGPDGYLYISLGDGGVHENAQDRQSLLGKILRLDVHGGGQSPDCGTGPYTVPADNPFVGDPNTCGEIWALGFRNPWRYSFDSLNGDLYIGDVGEWMMEEVDFQSGSSLGGENYGWGCYEGSAESPYYTATLCTDSYTFPIHEYDHTVGYTVVGGYIYRGCGFSDMYGKYYFADYVFGTLWSLEADGLGGYSLETLLNPAPQQISSFGQGYDGELYLLGYDLASNNGRLYHLAGNEVGSCFAFTHNVWLPTMLKP